MSLMTKQRSKEEWAEIVKDYKRSGMSIRTYAEKNDISAKTLSNHTLCNAGSSSNTGNKRRKLDEWAILISEQNASGLPAAVWCKKKGISIQAMRDAERKIRTAESKKPQSWV